MVSYAKESKVCAMNYKIVASDLDRTLLTDDHGVSPENMQAIAQLTEKGVHFVPASGRAYDEMPKALLENPNIRYYITSDGACIYDKQTRTAHELAMEPALVKDVLDVVYQYPICPMIHYDTIAYVDAATHNPVDYAAFNMNDYWISFAMANEIPMENLQQVAYTLPRIQSIVPFFKDMADLEECREILSKDSRLLLAQTDPYNLEIFSCKAGKGNALHYLADMLGIDRAATIAVGDSTNDMTMVQAAGLGLAVENAVPELKKAADRIICPYYEHSAKYILEHYF